jgi:hypothetical protein
MVGRGSLVNCPGCGKPLFLPGALGTWHDRTTGRLVMVYAICRECMRMVEDATPEEQTAFAEACELALAGGRPN